MSTDNGRMLKDFHNLSKAFKVINFDNLKSFTVVFNGPKGTPYEGGIWHVRVQLKDTYPSTPPAIQFGNRIFHPNIHFRMGVPCLDVMKAEWNAQFNLEIIFQYFLPQLLAYPNPQDPVNIKAAILFMEKPIEFKEKVTECIKQFATENNIKDENKWLRELDDDDDNSSLSSSSMSDMSHRFSDVEVSVYEISSDSDSSEDSSTDYCDVDIRMTDNCDDVGAEETVQTSQMDEDAL